MLEDRHWGYSLHTPLLVGGNPFLAAWTQGCSLMSGSGPWPGGVGGISTSLLWPYSRGGGGMSCTAEPPYFTASLYCCCTVTVWGGGGSWGLQQEGEALCFSKQWPCIDGGSHRGGCSTSSAVTFPIKSGQRFFGLVPTEAVILAAKASRCLSGKGEGGHQTYSLPSHC